jgi:hypothetical protein
MSMTPILTHGAGSQPYLFDRLGVDDIAWFRSEWNATEIPSAPQSLSILLSSVGSGHDHGNGKGHSDHGNGHGYGHTEIPEPSTTFLLIAGVLVILLAQLVSSRRNRRANTPQLGEWCPPATRTTTPCVVCGKTPAGTQVVQLTSSWADDVPVRVCEVCVTERTADVITAASSA